MRPASIFFIALFLCVVMFQNVVAQVTDQWIYNDTLVSPWLDESWNSTTTYNSTEHVYAGSNAIKAVQTGYGGLAFRAGEWGSPVNVNPSNYTHLEFAVYSVTAGLALEISVGDDVGDYSTPYTMTNFPLNQWVIVAVSMADINSSNMTFNNIYIGNSTALSNTYYVDAVRLVGNTGSTSAPPTPTLVTVDSNSTNQSKRPFLSWNLSSSATSYRLQVSTSSSFSSTVFDDSTLSLTLQKITNPSNITNLANSTTYYWRVKAKNSYGTSSYSNTWHFTTSSPNSTDQWIYQDTLIPRWTTVPSWATTITLQQTAHVFDGTYSLKSEQTAFGAMFFRSGDWGPPVEVDPTDYDSLKFDFYTVTDGFDLGVYLFNESSEFTYGVNLTSLTANQWYHFSIPITSLAPDSEIISNIVFYNLDDGDGVYYVDDIRLLAHPSSASVPSVPTLTSPSNAATNQSSWAMLKWHLTDPSTIDYRLQVATDSSFSSVVFNDSTITDTLRMTTTLAHSSTYYWHVNARNTIGRGGWSSTWHFTTQPDTVPTLVVAPVDSTIPTVLSEANKFLYLGTNAVQFGMDTSKLNALRFSTVRGKVMGPDSLPLSGVKITVLNHSEFGYTFTHIDGSFDMVVNGGGLITLNYKKDGFLPAQRQVDAPWQGYGIAKDVILISLDPNVTTINFLDTIKAARGSVISDSNGTRQATLFFKKGTSANLIFPDSTITVNKLNIRATEYTVGNIGHVAMPAQLPPMSAYTYAVELNADEAINAGAHGIEFDHPVTFYLENYLNFPVGSPVPVGRYSQDSGVWIPTADGRVIRIVGVSGGKAQIDINGDSTADSNDSLAVIGIDSSECRELATLYSVGQSLWRVLMNHFCPYDLNWPWRPASAAIQPNVGQVNNHIVDPKTQKIECGSVIRLGEQTLGEDVPITGTPFSLIYQSEKVSGHRASGLISVPVSTIDPSAAKRMDVIIDVAGNEFSKSFAPASNVMYNYVWNREDAYGRVLQGRHHVTTAVGYAYSAVYALPVFNYENFELGSDYNLANPGISEFEFWQNSDGYTLSSVDVKPIGLGGWTLDIHHVYDPLGFTLFLGNGDHRQATSEAHPISSVPGTAADAQQRVAVGPDGRIYYSVYSDNRVYMRVSSDSVVTIAGNGTTGFSGDGGSATAAELHSPSGIAIASDGSIYIADVYNNRIRKVSQSGIITTVAGDSVQGFSGDGGLAINAELDLPQSVALGPDGALYIADWRNSRVRRVSLDGIITTFAGNGGGYSGDSGSAIDAGLSGPYGLAFMQDGSLLIADVFDNVVRKVTPDGIITTIAGNGIADYSGDEGPATSASLQSPVDVAVGKNDVIYIADELNQRIRKVYTDGTISTLAGTGIYYLLSDQVTNGDDGPSEQAIISFPSGLAVGPNDVLYVADNPGTAIASTVFFSATDSRIRQITTALPRFSDDELSVASEDGSEIYVFDKFGRHLRTQDAITGVTLLRFGYDSLGRLSSVRDRDSLLTIIERDSTGNPTAIISPFGQHTVFSVDTAGYLSSISDPAGNAQHFTYYSGGLLATKTDPRGGVYEFTYDTLGRLVGYEDPAGGTKSITLSDVSGGFKTSMTTAMGAHEDQTFTNYSDGSQQVVEKDRAGLTRTTTFSPGDTTSTNYPNGMSVTTVDGPDPRFGMQAPITKQMTVMTPNGLSSTTNQFRTVTGLVGLTISGITDSIVVNGQTYKQEYDGTLRRFKNTSPEGRTSFTFIDSMGRVLQDSVPGVLPIKYTYDSLSFPKTVSQGGRTSQFSYDYRKRLHEIIDPIGHASIFDYDSTGRVTEQILANGSEIFYTYDSSGNLVSLTPPGKTAHTFTYTPVDLTHKYSPPEILPDTNWSTNYSYNLDRQLTHTFLPNGDSIVIRYDTSGCGCSNAGRPAEIHFDRGSLTFAYDSLTGNLKRIVAPGNDTLSYSFDGSLLTKEKWSGDVTDSVQYTYDNNFRVTKQKINNSDSVTFSYDNDGLLKNVGDLSIGRSAQTGLLTADTLGNVTSKRSYDSLGNLSNLIYRYSGDTLYRVSYVRDSLSRITQQTETIQGVTKTFAYTYDTIGRLNTVKRNDTIISHYYYDQNGNRDSLWTLSGGTVHGTYDNQDRLLTYGSASYIYTKNGELSKKIEGTDTTKYTYDYLGNLTEVYLPSGDVIDYMIDGQNRRIGKKLNGGIVNRWIYSGQLTPVAELDSAGNIASRFVGSYMIKGDSTYRIVRDHLGSVRLIVNTQTGAIAQRIDYDEFGNILTNTNSNFIPFGFAGGLYESQTELVRFGARDYAAKSGRWTSKDPIGFGGGVSNIYEYVVNDPIDLFDRTGLQIIVIENGPTQHNPIGHTAIAIAGAGVYSYGNNTPLGLSLVDYLTSQAPNRTTNVYVMQTTPEQDAAALKYLTSHTSPLGTSALDVLTDNCSTRSNNALDAAGIPRISELLQDRGVIDPPFDYISMPGYAGLRALLYGADVYSIPQGSTTIPFSLKKF